MAPLPLTYKFHASVCHWQTLTYERKRTVGIVVFTFTVFIYSSRLDIGGGRSCSKVLASSLAQFFKTNQGSMGNLFQI
jgi:hypothetical protein